MRRVTSALLLSSAALAGAAAFFVSQAPAQFASSPFGSPPGTSSASCGESEACAAVSYEATTTDGGAGFTCDGMGQCVQQGPGCSGFATDPNTGYMYLGGLACAPIVRLGDTITLQQGQIVLAGQLNLTGAQARILLSPSTLQTCYSGSESLLQMDGTSGASTGHPSRVCICRSDGAGTYKWWNMFSAASTGTTTTCPD